MYSHQSFAEKYFFYYEIAKSSVVKENLGLHKRQLLKYHKPIPILVSMESFNFFSIRAFFWRHCQLTGSREMEGTFFYSTLPLPPTHEHSDIYVQLCTWDDYHIFLFATFVFTRLLLDEIYHYLELLFHWLIMWYWFNFVCLLIWFKALYSNLTWEKPVDSNSRRLSPLYYKRTG